MMLEHLGEKPAAERLMKAVEHVTADPFAPHAGPGWKGDHKAGHRRRLRGPVAGQRLGSTCWPMTGRALSRQLYRAHIPAGLATSHAAPTASCHSAVASA